MQRRRISLTYYAARQELWLASPGDASGSVVIYHAGLDCFYRFSGIDMDRTVASAGEPRFLLGETLMEFSEKLKVDPSGRQIVGSYRSGWLDFGHPWQTKHALRFFSEYDGDGEAWILRFRTDRGECDTALLTGRASELPASDGRRVSLGRFRYLSFELTAEGAARQGFSQLAVTVRK